MLLLGDVIEHEAFGLELVAGGAGALERPVAGAHNSEMPEPSRFLPPDWVMLTLGMRLRADAAAQRELVAELDDARLCALGFGVGVAFDRVPGALRDAADARGFPVFVIPYDTAYREIIGFVNRSLLSNDFQIVHRSLGMQGFLMDALREDDPVAGLVQRLGRMLDSTVILFDGRGHVQAASREVAAEAIWEQVHGSEQTVHRALVDGADVVSVPIQVRDQPRRWLVIASRVRSLPRQLALSVIQSTERLLELIALSQQAAADDERAMRSGLLASALQPQHGYEPAELEARMRRHGVELERGARLLAIEPCRDDERFAVRGRRVVEEQLDREEIPHLITTRASRLLILAEAPPDQLTALVEEFGERIGTAARAGCGRLITTVQALPRALKDALVALRGLEARGRSGLLLFEDYDIASWLLGTVPAEDLSVKAAALVGPLREHPELCETLVAYLRADARVAATARTLNLHENSLRYRLAKIEALLGCSLRELPTLVDLYLATLIDDLS